MTYIQRKVRINLTENIYELNVSGYDEYLPVWFKSERSKTAFKRIVRGAIHKAVPSLIKKGEWGYETINGHDLMKKIIPVLEAEGFEKTTPDITVGLYGGCRYNRGRWEKPPIISREDWKTIVEHNEMAEKAYYANAEEKQKKRSKKQKRKDDKEKLESLNETIESLSNALENAKAKKVKLEKQIG